MHLMRVSSNLTSVTPLIFFDLSVGLLFFFFFFLLLCLAP